MPVDPSAPLVLHFAPRTRALTVLWGLEELGLAYRLASFDVHSGRQHEPDYLQVNPLGKVPAVVDERFEGEPVACAETGAILTWLGDLAGPGPLVPAPDEPERAAYLRWMFFSGSVIEPCIAEHFFQWEVPSMSVSWGSLERMRAAVEPVLEAGPWLLGSRFTLADVVCGATLRFGVVFGALPKEGPIADYVGRLEGRTALVAAKALEAGVAAELASA